MIHLLNLKKAFRVSWPVNVYVLWLKVISFHCKVRQKQLAIDQLKYELSTEGRRNIEQLNANKQKIASLELQLAQVRHEADEYYKTGLERNLEATALGNQVRDRRLQYDRSAEVKQSQNLNRK